MRQLRIADAATTKADPSVYIDDVLFVDTDGNPTSVGGGSAYVLPAATANALGGVKLQVFGDTIGNANENVAVAAAAAPTKTEYDALVASYNSLAKQFNRLISGLAKSGVIQLPASS